VEKDLFGRKLRPPPAGLTRFFPFPRAGHDYVTFFSRGSLSSPDCAVSPLSRSYGPCSASRICSESLHMRCLSHPQMCAPIPPKSTSRALFPVVCFNRPQSSPNAVNPFGRRVTSRKAFSRIKLLFSRFLRKNSGLRLFSFETIFQPQAFFLSLLSGQVSRSASLTARVEPS